MWRSKLHPQTSFSLVQFIEERNPPMELPLLDHSSPVLCILFLSGDTTYKKTSPTDYQHVSKNYCHRKIPKDWRRSLQDNECIQPPDSDLVWFQSHLLPLSSHWLQVLQCCSQIAPGVPHPGSCPEPSGRLFLLLLLRWAKVRKSHPSAGKPPIKHQKNFTSLG